MVRVLVQAAMRGRKRVAVFVVQVAERVLDLLDLVVRQIFEIDESGAGFLHGAEQLVSLCMEFPGGSENVAGDCREGRSCDDVRTVGRYVREKKRVDAKRAPSLSQVRRRCFVRMTNELNERGDSNVGV